MVQDDAIPVQDASEIAERRSAHHQNIGGGQLTQALDRSSIYAVHELWQDAEFVQSPHLRADHDRGSDALKDSMMLRPNGELSAWNLGVKLYLVVDLKRFEHKRDPLRDTYVIGVRQHPVRVKDQQLSATHMDGNA
jgi:hypothetical protein